LTPGFVEPAILVGQQRFDVERRDVFESGRIAPDAVGVGECTQRRAVAGEDDGAAGGGVGEWERVETIEQKQQRNDDQHRRDKALKPATSQRFHL